MTYDAIVIGGSFAGLAAATQLARARRRVVVLDGQRPRNRFARASHGFLGQDGRTPLAILDEARAQLLAYPTAEFVTDEATGASREDGVFQVALASGTSLRGDRLVLAFGVVDELPDIPGLRDRWGISVLHCPYCHGYEIAGGRFGVLAASEMAIPQAYLLTDWGAEVTLFANDAVSPDEELRSALAARGIRLERQPVVALHGEDLALQAVELRDGTTVSLDALFVAPRTRLATSVAGQLGCAIDSGPVGPVIRTTDRKATTVPGVFAAGDVARPGHTVSWAVADGVMAGIAAHQSLVLPPAFAPPPAPADAG